MQNSDLDINENSAYNASDKARGYNSKEACLCSSIKAWVHFSVWGWGSR